MNTVDLSQYPSLGDWEEWEKAELEAAVRRAEQHKRNIAQMEEGAAAEQATQALAKRAPAERRKRAREQQRQARAGVAADVAVELAQLRPPAPPARLLGRPSLLSDPAVRALFKQANAAGCTARELAAVFGIGERTVRSYRGKIRDS
jgi:hypothetical protein